MPEALLLEPATAALSESLRAFGYTFGDAIADLIDNSITAGATAVRVEASLDHASIKVIDNGKGMTFEGLLAAMRAGSQNPLEVREAKDLGRFGLGLKTASFSQARRLVVASRPTNGDVSMLGWDLDHLQRTQRWEVLRWHPGEADFSRYASEVLTVGTVVTWENADRVFGRASQARQRQRLLERLDLLRSHLALVFGPRLARGDLRIWVMDAEVLAFDPFLANHAATRSLGMQTFRLKGTGGRVNVTPYVLPFRSALTDEEFELAGQPGGWSARQGFYVYRGGRLLVGGHWLGLRFAREVPYNLARIRIDIDNDADDEWQIDVRKSRATPPEGIRDDLRRIGRIARERSAESYRRRGRIRERTQGEDDLLWHRTAIGERFRFVVNRDHSLLRAFAASLDQATQTRFNSILSVIEKAVPTRAIVVASAEHEDSLTTPFEGESDPESVALAADFLRLFTSQGISLSEAVYRLRLLEPFSEHPEFVDCAQLIIASEECQ